MGNATPAYWLFNAEQVESLDCDAADLWFKHHMGFSANGWKEHGEPLRKMEVGDYVLMYQNEKGYVGIGRVRQKWNEKEYWRPLVYKNRNFEEYRIPIDWFLDARDSPFQIGYVSSRFLVHLKDPAILARVKRIVSNAESGRMPPPLPDEADDDYRPGKQDGRKRVIRQIHERRGQKTFRDRLRKRYGDTCQITGCQILDIIEAAHICPYRGAADNNVNNGVLLRADIHTLFDLNLIGIHPDTLKVRCSKQVAKEYGRSLVGRKLSCPKQKRPSRLALSKRYKEFLADVEDANRY